MSGRHECPEDADAFFAQLWMVLVYKPEPPEGFAECPICGGLIPDRAPAAPPQEPTT